MLVILAHPRDEAARALALRWHHSDARLMTPRDLSRPGWRHHVGARGGDEWCVAAGERVPTALLDGVITRLPSVAATDLPHIGAGDRDYVAAEMTAFLASWLTRLRCPVLNRPDATSLMGPNRGRERWLALAARAGLRLAQRTCGAPAVPPAFAAATVTVVGQQWLGDVARELGAQSVCLAQRAGVDLLTVQFDTPEADAGFVCAELMIDPSVDAVADALLTRVHAEAAA